MRCWRFRREKWVTTNLAETTANGSFSGWFIDLTNEFVEPGRIAGMCAQQVLPDFIEAFPVRPGDLHDVGLITQSRRREFQLDKRWQRNVS